MLHADNWRIREKIKLYNWRYYLQMNLAKKISILLLVLIIASSCSRKRAPSKGCDCPGGHGMLMEKTPLKLRLPYTLKTVVSPPDFLGIFATRHSELVSESFIEMLK